MRYIEAATSFIAVFAIAFVLGGWYLMPHLPPFPDHVVTVFDSEYWTTNWVGCLLGIILGGLSARQIFKMRQRG